MRYLRKPSKMKDRDLNKYKHTRTCAHTHIQSHRKYRENRSNAENKKNKLISMINNRTQPHIKLEDAVKKEQSNAKISEKV